MKIFIVVNTDTYEIMASDDGTGPVTLGFLSKEDAESYCTDEGLTGVIVWDIEEEKVYPVGIMSRDPEKDILIVNSQASGSKFKH